jgi:hypothetical protein
MLSPPWEPGSSRISALPLHNGHRTRCLFPAVLMPMLASSSMSPPIETTVSADRDTVLRGP